jgi:hypothetical protein
VSEKKRAMSLSPHQRNRLDWACVPIRKAWDTPPYLVGSVMRGGAYRDVDVRTILDDDTYDRWFSAPESGGASHRDPRWALICHAVSEWLSALSGLPVDYQIQRQTEANAATKGEPRGALGVFHPWSTP